MSALSIATKQAIATSAEGYPLLGQTIYWSIADVEIPYDSFVAILEELGIDSDVAVPVQTKSAVIKAIHSHTRGQKELSNKKVLDDSARTGFIISRTTVTDSENIDVTTATETKVVMDKATKEVRVYGPTADGLNLEIDRLKGTYDNDRMRNVVLRYIQRHCQSIAVRDRGGVYFIPSTHTEALDKLKRLFERFPSSSLDMIPVIDTQLAKKSMWKCLVGNVTEELNRLEEDFANLAPDVTDKSLEVRLKRYQKLRDKAENYETLLSGTAEDLKNRLDRLTKTVKEKLVG